MREHFLELKDLYYRIIQVANFFLQSTSSLTLTIEALNGFNPTVEQIAKNMRMLATVLKDLASDSYEDEGLALNAFQCCLIMERLADALKDGRENELGELVRSLEIHTRVP